MTVVLILALHVQRFLRARRALATRIATLLVGAGGLDLATYALGEALEGPSGALS